MKKTNPIPGFDAVAFKRRAALRVFGKIKGMPPSHEIAYFNQATQNGPLAEYWSRLMKESRQCQPASTSRARKAS